MCGIVGVFSKRDSVLPVSSQDMVTALNRLKHRGPDTQHITALLSDGQVLTHSLSALDNNPAILNSVLSPVGYLAHARLKIIDMSDSSNQPLTYTVPNGKTYWITYNGEIYNYLSLKQRLQEQGYCFSTQCDTEILPALYDWLGPSMVSELNGMFAFAIWDIQEQQLFLARDRYGIKPLYLWQEEGLIAFASELKSLLALPNISRKFNYQALYEHFTFQFSLDNQTFIQGVHHFPKGHYAAWNASTGEYSEECYWQPTFQLDSTKSERDWFAEIELTLAQSVKSQLLGDVPVGSFLSGGIDTGAITAFAVSNSSADTVIDTVTCGFDMAGLSGDESLFDEREAARKLVSLLKTSHHEQVIDSSTLPAVLDDLVWHLDDFQAGISYQNLVTAELAKQYMTVILSGVGGDELFAGYPWRYQTALDALLSKEQFEEQHYQICTRLLNDERKQKLFSKSVLNQVSELDTRRLFQKIFDNGKTNTRLQQALSFDMNHFLPALLTVEDRLSMAVGLESRVPFLDNHLVDLCLAMPDELKLKYQNQDLVSKYALKQTLQKHLPEWVLNARKQGFTPPDASWYRGDLSGWIESRLFSEIFLNRDIIQPDFLRQLWNEHQSGEQNHRFLIWSLLCLESWCRQFLDANEPTI